MMYFRHSLYNARKRQERLTDTDFHELFIRLGLDIADFSAEHGKCDCGKKDVDIFIVTTNKEQEIIFPNRHRVKGRKFSIGNDCAMGFAVIQHSKEKESK